MGFSNHRGFCLHGLSWGGSSVGRNHGLGSSVGRSRGVSHRLDLVHVLGVSVVDLLAHLLGQGELNSLAGGGGQLGDALLLKLDVVHDLGDGEALLLSEVLARDPDQVDGLLDALLDGLGEGNLDILDVLSDDGDVVASLLGDLLAVVVAVLVVSVARGGLADGDHLGVAFPGEGDGDGLGGGGDNLLAVGVDTDLVVNNLNTLTAHGAGHRVALLDINDLLGGNLNGLQDGLKGRGADLGGLNNINNAAVVLGGMVGVMDRGMHDSVVGNGVVGSVVNHGGSMVHSVVGKRGGVVNSVVGKRCGVNCVVDRGSMGNGATSKGCEGNLGLGGSQDSGEEGSNGECLHDVAL